MTHLDKGKYFQKHSNQAKIDDSLRQEILQKAKENNIACAVAEEISQRKEMTLADMGMAIDLLNINLVECQLGLFGYSPQKKIVQPAKEVVLVLKENILAVLDNGRLPCIAAWEIAGKLNIPRMKVSAACEALQIKIKPCQLGAF